MIVMNLFSCLYVGFDSVAKPNFFVAHIGKIVGLCMLGMGVRNPAKVSVLPVCVWFVCVWCLVMNWFGYAFFSYVGVEPYVCRSCVVSKNCVYVYSLWNVGWWRCLLWWFNSKMVEYGILVVMSLMVVVEVRRYYDMIMNYMAMELRGDYVNIYMYFVNRLLVLVQFLDINYNVKIVKLIDIDITIYIYIHTLVS